MNWKRIIYSLFLISSVFFAGLAGAAGGGFAVYKVMIQVSSETTALLVHGLRPYLNPPPP